MSPCAPRPLSYGLLGLLLFLIFAFAPRAFAIDAAVVINEIHYHPATGADSEWIELHSLSGVDIDVSGWRLTNGIEFTFPANAKITGHGYLIVAANTAASSLSGLNPLGPWSGALNNAGDTITLVNRDGREMDAVSYEDDGDWPAGSDGSGATLARRNSESADPAPASWASSADVGGTPGRANFAVNGQAPTVTTPALLDSTWKSFVGTPPAGWQQPGFDDAAWPAAQSLFYSGTPTLAGGSDGLLGYWPLNETSGSTTANVAPGGSAANLFNAPTWTFDATRNSQVLQFSGSSQYVNAGSSIVPQMTLTNDFTWSFWANSSQGANTNIIIGNRYSPTPGVEWSPREFIKFTTSSFEFHRNATPEDIDYADIAAGSGWMHHAVVKSGSQLTYYRNAVVGGTRTMTQGLIHPQSLYFGGEQVDEYWAGKLDDVAIWNRALTGTQIGALNSGAATPLTVTSAGSLRTQLAASSIYAFRRAFNFTGSPSRTTLTLKLLIEDGCTVWLNGTQVYTVNNPPTFGTASAAISADIPIPSTALIRGNNVLAIEVGTFAGDPDMVFGAQLTASEQAPTPTDATAGLVFNEISPGGASFQVELTNLSGGVIDLTGYSIRSSSGASFALSGTLNAGAYLSLTATQMGFTPVNGDKLFLFKPGGSEIADARAVANRLSGRSPQFPGRWLFPASATFGTANAFTFNTDIVINEIMYDQRPLTQSPFAEDPEQWVELYNRGGSPVTVSGWRFSDGISFIFPAVTTIPAGDYLVVSNNATALKAKWPSVAGKIIGNFTGNISRGGERVQLCDASDNPVNEVRFANDSPWPVAAHGEGSSLELRDPRADSSRPEAWRASDEASRGSWLPYSFQVPATPSIGNDPTAWNEFIFGLLDRGSMLIDDISVIEDPNGTNRQLITNGAFDSGTTGWRFLGTHSRATVVPDPSGGGQVLRVDATDSTEHMHNHVETTLKANNAEVTINPNLNYRVSFRARWISGSNLLNSRLYFNRLANTTVLPVAPGGGTPGSVNTAFTANAGPTFSGLTHTPPVPAANQAATVSVVAADPDGLGVVTLFYSVNGGAFTSTGMTHQGGGNYTGSIPGQAAGVKVQFYVQAADSTGAIAFAPGGGSSGRAMIQWNDGQARLVLNNVSPNNIRIVMKPADITTLHTVTNVMSNDRLPCTVIWNERDIYYDCGIHLHGSERGRNQSLRVSFNVRFPGDRPLLGIHDSVVIDRSGAGNQFSQKEILIKRAITRAAGIPGSEDDLCRVIAPQGAQTGPAIFGRQRVVTGEYLDSAYPSGGDGDLFKYELIYYPTTTTGVSGNRGNPESLKFPEPDNVAGVATTDNLGTNKEAYRWHWLIANREEADDYSGLMTWLTAFRRGADAQYFTDTNNLMDVSEWLRSFAVTVLFGIGDNYSSGAQHNLYVYRRPSDAKWLMLPYDMDFTFSSGQTSTLFPNSDLGKLTQNQGNRRTYYRHIYELCQSSFASSYLLPWATHYNAFVSEDLTQWMSYIDGRRSFALTTLNTDVPSVAFNITTPNGPAPGPTVTINGTAWLDVNEMRLAGSTQPLNVTWTSTTAWQTSVTIAPGTNTITINAFNASGAQIAFDTVVITGTGSIIPASASNLVISEIMYHPGPPTAAEQAAGFTDSESFEFLELQNISPTNTISLAGSRFTAGVAFNLPNINLAPGARALLVGNQAAFTKRYGSGLTIIGAYQPGNFLANDGDHLTLLDSQGQVIRDFSFEDESPWPSSADGLGYSLILINPASNPDHALAQNWRSSSALNGNPGTSDATTFSGNPNGDDNSDGYSNLIQYALAGTGTLTLPTAANDGSFLTIRFTRNLAAEDAVITVQRSVDLSNWSSGSDVAYVDETRLPDGTAIYTWRSTHPLGQGPGEYLRLLIQK